MCNTLNALVRFDEKNGFGGIGTLIKSLKETPKITEEVSNALNKLIGKSLEFATDFEITGKNLGSTDETFVKFLKHLKEQNIVYTDSQSALAGYQSYLQSTAKASAMATLRTKALSVAMKAVSAIGWTFALTAATNLIGKGIDALSDLANAFYIEKSISKFEIPFCV